MTTKTLQYFSQDYLEQCKTMSPDQIIQFLDDFRQLHGSQSNSKSKLISMKVPEDLLNTFKAKAKFSGTPYQTQIKALMKSWVLEK
ncbi:MAG: BrnA antitoxin family protein [Gammaproteobacteria bacterium]|jgi:predicted DNA binding CopG/RHH family protein|nr:BrnA antitoxin family protein [Gammaproteobacteria bacterium]